LLNIFGYHDLKEGPIFNFKGHNLNIKKYDDDTYIYKREHREKIESEVLIPSNEGKVKLALYPIRPIHIPKDISHHIMIILDPPISIPPRTNLSHYLTVPIEIGVFSSSGKDYNLMIDTFSIIQPKYGLYGVPESGVICRLHESSITPEYSSSIYESAALNMVFRNNNSHWALVKTIVMDAYLVDFYLKGNYVFMEKSSFEVEDDKQASINLSGKPPMRDLKLVPVVAESVRKFRLNVLQHVGLSVKGKFLMEYGY
jgi:hypothetical protein